MGEVRSVVKQDLWNESFNEIKSVYSYLENSIFSRSVIKPGHDHDDEFRVELEYM